MPGVRPRKRSRSDAFSLVLAVVAGLLMSGCTSCFKGVCEDDLGRYCGMEKPGGASHARCVEQFQGKFSKECQEDLQEKKGTK